MAIRGARHAGPLVRAGSAARLEAADDVEPERSCTGAVDHAVVEREREVPHARDRDLTVAHDRPLVDAADAEDRDLRVVHDRRLEEAGELAGARDAEGGAADLLG